MKHSNTDMQCKVVQHTPAAYCSHAFSAFFRLFVQLQLSVIVYCGLRLTYPKTVSVPFIALRSLEKKRGCVFTFLLPCY